MGLFDAAANFLNEQKKKLTNVVQKAASYVQPAISNVVNRVQSFVTPKPSAPVSRPSAPQSTPVFQSRAPVQTPAPRSSVSSQPTSFFSSSPTGSTVPTPKPKSSFDPVGALSTLFGGAAKKAVEKVTPVVQKYAPTITSFLSSVPKFDPSLTGAKLLQKVPDTTIKDPYKIMGPAGEFLTGLPGQIAKSYGKSIEMVSTPEGVKTLFGTPKRVTEISKSKKPIFSKAGDVLADPGVSAAFDLTDLFPGGVLFGGLVKAGGKKIVKEAAEKAVATGGKEAVEKVLKSSLAAFDEAVDVVRRRLGTADDQINAITKIRQIAENYIPKKELSKMKNVDEIIENVQGKVADFDYLTPRTARAVAPAATKALEAPPIRKINLDTGPDLERGFVTTVKNSPITAPQVANQVTGTYGQLTNPESMTRAAEVISKQGYDVSRNSFFKASPSTETHAIGLQLMNMAQTAGRYDDAAAIAKSLAEKATEAGQMTQIFSVYSKLTPEGMLRYAARTFEEANENKSLLDNLVKKTFGVGRDALELTPDDARFISEKMRAAQNLVDGIDKDKAIKEVLEYINEKIPPSFSELFDAYRYSNLLSSPRTQERNFYGNLLQALVVRPVVLATSVGVDTVKAGLTGKEREYYARMVPEYYKSLLNSLPNASHAFKEVWKGIGEIEQRDLQNVSALRRNVLPSILTVVPRLMEGADKFFRVLISSGEYAARRSGGMADDAAKAAADQVAEYSLLRSALDPNNATGQGFFLSKIDQATKTVLSIRNKVPFLSWFIPFVTTPMNFTKQWIEYSPVGAINALTTGPAQKTEAIAKAIIGSSVTGFGATLALQGKTTWATPVDPKEKELFYASGKKPFSININGQWVPMIYFGPFAFALAVPAAFQQYQKDSKTALTDSQLEKAGKAIAGLAEFFGEQTFLSGLGNFARMISGDTDYGTGRTAAGLAAQAIPADAFLRWVTQIVDPVFRKTSGEDTLDQAIASIKAQIPFLSKTLPAYIEPSGDPSTRNWTDTLLPWGIESENQEYDQLLDARRGKLQENNVNQVKAKEIMAQLVAMKEQGASQQERDKLFLSQDKDVQSRIKSLVNDEKPTKFVEEQARAIRDELVRMKESGVSKEERDAYWNSLKQSGRLNTDVEKAIQKM